MAPAIAVADIGCCYPDAGNPRELWENILAGRRSFRRIPPERLNLDDYFSADPATPDAIYAGEAALIEGYEFDRVRFRVAGPTYRAADLTHWLALDVADRALRDAGFPDGEGLPRETTGVLLGNTLTGEFSRAALMRLRWPYVRRVADAELRGQGWPAEQRRIFLDRMEALYKAPFEPVGEETLAGGLSNTIAGRICNHYHLRGGGYTLDGACSSSLLAVANACTALTVGDLDAALAGGVDLSLDPFELIGFAKTGALARGEMRVYDREPQGFLPGEGCGFVVLMRHADALAAGARCYAVIRGWGISSDGGGGITRPEQAGQALAIERAYRKAGYGPETVALFEGHGTGTAVGDEVELRTLAAVCRRREGTATPAAVGSIKANIGHTKAAAGVAGLIKASLALHAQVLPPATGTRDPHPVLRDHPSLLRTPETAEPWPAEAALRAGVSSFGFGGINAHIALEGAAAVRRRELTPGEAVLAGSAQDAELFLLAADSPEALGELAVRLGAVAPGLSHAELADLAAHLARQSGRAGFRGAVVAASPPELAEGLRNLCDRLAAGETRCIDPTSGVFLGTGEEPPRIGLLFPGQASPVRRRGGAFARRYAPVHALYRQAGLPEAADPTDSRWAQPAIITAELAGLEVLEHFGVRARLALGHSLGELAALYWAGALDREALLRLVHRRGEATTDPALPPGAMASLGLPATTVARWLEGEPDAVIAGYNGRGQTVVSGSAAAVARLLDRALAENAAGVRLPVSHAFHSPRMGPASAVLAGHLATENFAPVGRTVISTVTGRPLPADEDLPNLLVRQLTEPVLFAEALERAVPEVDLFVECGPGRVLCGLARETGIPALSLDSAGESWRGLLHVLGAVYALGEPIAAEALFADRFVRPFDPERRPRFFVNPCELAPPLEDRPAAGSLPSPPPPAGPEPVVSAPAGLEAGSGPGQALGVVRRLVAQRAELPLSAVRDEHRLLRDLHLNSISVGQMVAEAARSVGLPSPLAPTEYADATVAGVAEALESLRGTLPEAAAEPEGPPPGLESWVRAFRVILWEVPLPPAGRPPRRESPASAEPGRWRIFSRGPSASAEALAGKLENLHGYGVLVWLEDGGGEVPGVLLLSAAQAALALPERGAFVLVQRHGIAAAFARTLRLEAPELTVRVVDTPFDIGVADRVLAELRNAQGYAEAWYDEAGRRYEPRLRPEFGIGDGPLPLGPEDVLLASGGGKGIAAECVLALVRATGARAILLGRSRPEADPELAANLDCFEAAGVAWRYVAADVTDAEAVRSGLAEAQAGIGTVTALLHGAGLNRPKLIRDLREKDLAETLAPKLDGLRNLLAAVDAGRLRLLVAFGSIIGWTGLRGEADYALANAALRRRVEDFAAEHPACPCRVLEWSVWSGVGMGERLGRIDTLLRAGISPITPDQGVDWMLRALRQPGPGIGLLISGRLGTEPAIPVEGPAVPFQRFLENVRVYYPGVELVAEAMLSSETDPYLDDHVMCGERLLPAVLGLEAMAQAARAVLGESRLPVFEQVRFDRPIVVSEGCRLTLRILALVQEPGLVEVALRDSGSGFHTDAFRALCRFGPETERSEPAPAESEGPMDTPEDARGWYGPLFFHRGRFRRVTAYHELRARRCCADIAGDTESPWFGRYLPGELVLGDPGARDAAIHGIQACIPHALLLPVGIERLAFGAVSGPGPWTLRARERRQEGDLFVYDLEVTGTDGRLRERWEGLRLRRVAEVPWRAWPESLLAPYLERRIGELLPEGGLASLVLRRDRTHAGRPASEPALLRALGRETRIRRRPDGKPEVADGSALSAAHAGRLTLAVSGTAPLACDLEAVAERSGAAWRDLLGAERFDLAGFIAGTAGETLDGAATRVWTALECLKKAGLPGSAALSLETAEPDGWIVLGSGAVAVATYQARLEGGSNLGVAVLVRRNQPSGVPQLNALAG